jgi:hypothetical protein
MVTVAARGTRTRVGVRATPRVTANPALSVTQHIRVIDLIGHRSGPAIVSAVKPERDFCHGFRHTISNLALRAWLVLEETMNGKIIYISVLAAMLLGCGKTDSPKTVPLSPTLTDVTITDYGPSDQVRQGAGTIEITIKGAHLETLTTAQLGGAPLTIKSKQADGAVLEANIAHGATLGALTLTVTNPAGTFTRNAALEVVKITAAANPNLNPSDTTGKGTPNRPFRTVTKALSVAQKGDTVLLTAGSYSSDETWPQAATLTPPPAANVADGVTLEGQSETDRAAVVLVGPGADQNFSGLVLAGSAKIQNLTLRNFKYGVLYAIGDPNNPTVQIEVRKIASNSSFDGIHLRNAKTADVFDSEFYRNTASGIYAVGPTKLTASVSISDSNQYGIGVDAGVQLELSVTRCNSNSKDGIYLSLSSLTGQRLEVQQNGGNGLNSLSQNGAQTISIRNSSFSNNANRGVWIQGHPGNIALGTFSANFADMLLNNNGAEQVYDDRDSSSYFFIKAQIGGADTPTGVFGKGATPAGVTIVQPDNVILFNNPI